MKIININMIKFNDNKNIISMLIVVLICKTYMIKIYREHIKI